MRVYVLFVFFFFIVFEFESASHMCCIYALCACCVVDKLQLYTEKPKRQPTLTAKKTKRTHIHQNITTKQAIAVDFVAAAAAAAADAH